MMDIGRRANKVNGLVLVLVNGLALVWPSVSISKWPGPDPSVSISK